MRGMTCFDHTAQLKGDSLHSRCSHVEVNSVRKVRPFLSPIFLARPKEGAFSAFQRQHFSMLRWHW